MKTSSAQYIGIWHAEVLSMAMEEGYPGMGPIQSSLRLLIGEVGPAGFTSDIQVPWVSGCVSCSWKVEEQSAWSASGVMRMHTPQSHTSAPKDQETASCFRIHQVHAISGVGRSVHVLHASALCSCEQLRTSDQVEVLVMSSEPYFEDFQVVRDLYVPAIGLWLADYPFLKRDAFQRLSEDIYWSRQEANS